MVIQLSGLDLIDNDFVLWKIDARKSCLHYIIKERLSRFLTVRAHFTNTVNREGKDSVQCLDEG